MKVRKAANVMPETEYIVKCNLAISGGMEESQEVKVKIITTEAMS